MSERRTRQTPAPPEDTPLASPAGADVEADVLRRLGQLRLDREKDAAERAEAAVERAAQGEKLASSCESREPVNRS
jgi:hypothetical protein